MKRILAALAVVLTLVFASAAQTPKKAESKKAATVEQPSGKTAKSGQTAKTQPIDINTATADQLKEIPGIGDAYSAKIIQGRPYRAKNELVQKNILPQSVYDKVKDRIVARQKK